MSWITPVKRATLKAKLSKHYKLHHAIEDMGLAANDRAVIDWAVAAIADIYPSAIKDN